jgi:adenylate cyclase
LRSPRFGAIVIPVLETLHTHAARTKVGAGGTADCASLPLTLADFADDRLRRLRKKVLALAARAHIDNPPSLHALRIGIKRLRYALEFFAPLASAKDMRRMVDHLASLQDTLGQINDLANAGELLMDCAGDDPALREAVTLIGGWHGPRHQKLLAAVPVGLKHLGRLRLPKLAVKQG